VELQGLVEESPDIPDRFTLGVGASDPVARAGILHQVGEKHGMAKAGEVVDVGRRGKANVDDAQAGFLLEPLAQRRPSAGVTRDSGPGVARVSSDRDAVLLLLNQRLNTLQSPCGPAGSTPA